MLENINNYIPRVKCVGFSRSTFPLDVQILELPTTNRKCVIGSLQETQHQSASVTVCTVQNQTSAVDDFQCYQHEGETQMYTYFICSSIT